MNTVQIKILELVRANDGQCSWYQIDRSLSESGIEHAGRLIPLLRELVAEGLIQAAAGPNPAQPVYSITEEGISAIAQRSK